MDPITQAALGAAVGHAAFHRQLGFRAAGIGAVVGMMPDLDSLYGAMEGPFARLVSHRGITHSLFFGPVVGALAGWSWWRYQVYRAGPNDPPPASQWAWMGLFICALFTHPLLDWFTTFGTQLLAPFQRTRFALDGIAIVDPVYTLMLGGGLLISWRLKGSAREGWPTALALLLTTGYLLVGLRMNTLAAEEAERQLAAADRPFISVRAYPTMLQLPHRRVVATLPDRVLVGYLSMWQPCEITWGERPLYTSPNVDTLLSSPEGKIFTWFNGERQIAHEYPDGDQQVVDLIDLRYGYTLDVLQGLWIVRARFDAEGKMQGRPERLQQRPPVSGNTLGDLMRAAFANTCDTPRALKW